MMKTAKHILEKIKEAKEKQLKELDLSGHIIDDEKKLTQIPGEVFELKHLEVLDLGFNKLTNVPDSISQLKNLTSLFLYSNQLTYIDPIFQLQNLTLLDLSGNQLITIPNLIFQQQNLNSLYLGYNQLTTVPDSISQLKNLTSLDLSYNQLANFPEPVSQLQNLNLLSLYSNKLTSVPDSISQLQNLTSLNLGGNKFTTVPDPIFQLKNLTSLYLSRNKLSTVPDSISQLQNLTVLSFDENHFTSIPDAIYKLHSLKKLNFIINRIKNISRRILQLKNLKEFRVNTDTIETPPPEVVNKGLKAIKDYFIQLEAEGKDYLYEAKFLIVGEAGAGKTTFAKKIENQEYKLQDEDTTKGIDVIRWEFPLPEALANSQTIARPDTTFRVNIWDFGGQEIYHATHQFFLTKRSLYALVADTRKEDTDFYYWLNVVELLSDSSPLLIIKNEKQDRHREINDRQLRGQFTNLKESLATNLATNRGLPEILKEIKHYISNLPHIGAELPKTWVIVRETLENDPRNYISLDEYLEICEQNSFKQLKDKLQLSGYLHDLGVCLHFKKDLILKRTVILKPEWGTAAVYKVLDNSKVIRNLGRFTRDDLVNIWTEETYANMQDELLQLMINFKLCYKIKNSEFYIAPQLLTGNAPDYNWDETDNLLLRYTYEFMPKGIITRFIVEMHRLIAEQIYVWKSGVILQKNGAKAEVIEYYGKREIKIRISGKHKKELMTIVTYELDKIHSTYKRLKFHKWIPCNCSVCNNRREPHFYKFERLRKRISDKQYQVECDESYEKVDVLILIDDVMDKKQFLKGEEEIFHLWSDIKTNRLLEPEKEIFLSYSWDGESEEIVNLFDKAFQEKGITIARDKRDLGFKGHIKDFMEKIGRGKCVIVVICKKYLESENCMFELMQIARNGDFYDRIFPIVLEDAKIYDPVDRIKYVQYWEKKKRDLDGAMKSVSTEYLEGFREEIDLYADIRKYLPQLANILKDMNTLTAKIHTDTGFNELIKAVESKMAE